MYALTFLGAVGGVLTLDTLHQLLTLIVSFITSKALASRSVEIVRSAIVLEMIQGNLKPTLRRSSEIGVEQRHGVFGRD